MTVGFGAEKRVRAGLSVGVLLLALVTLADAQAPRTVQDGVFSEAQAARGQTLYAAQCATCHGATLGGAQGPPLVGDAFVERWRTRPLADLASKIQYTMPAGAQGTLTAAQSADLVAYMLSAGRFPAGVSDLPTSAGELARIGWPQPPAGSGLAAVAAPPAPVYPPLGNMAQLMRGIYFPNSNLLFTVQTRDPGAPQTPPSPGAQPGGFSWVDWGAGIYGGWELVDNAAIALADAAPLMLVPGIRCENGRLAPVTEPDWIRFTEEMIAVSRRIYRASQTRSQEAVSELTGDLSDSCFNCHQAYRDRRTPGRPFDPSDPSNKASRCMPR